MLHAIRSLLVLGLFALALTPRPAAAVAEPRLHGHDFLGEQSCSTSGCHGGGVGKNQTITWEKKDAHAKASAILRVARSKGIGDALGIPDVTRDARCTTCHSPLESVPADRLAESIKPDQGVSCETCHGPAEPWIRFHTRKDITRDQRLASGMREMKDLYHRANTCVACHLYLSPEVAKAGHPEMFFELATQMKNEPPHWVDTPAEGLEPRAWLIGQATALRELSWRLGKQSDEEIAARVEGLRWLLATTSQGASLPASHADARTTQTAADRLAKSAEQSTWTRTSTLAQLRKFTETSAQFRDPKTSAPEQRRRAEVLMLAVNTFWQSLKAGGTSSPLFEQAYAIVMGEVKKGTAFDPALFAGTLQQLEVAMVQLK